MYILQMYHEIVDPKYGNQPLNWYDAGMFTFEVDAQAQLDRFVAEGTDPATLRIVQR